MSAEFNRIENHSHTINRCPICAAKAELWEVVNDNSYAHHVAKFVACGRKEDEQLVEGMDCPLVMPDPASFYRPTLREAVQAWNEFEAAAFRARSGNLAD